MSNVIGLCGAKGSGKDYFYKVVKKAFPLHDIRKIAYADPIKHEVCRIFGLDTEREYDDFKRIDIQYTIPGKLSHGIFGRQVVRELGMMMRSYDEMQFVRYVEDEIEKAPSAIWCITDLRFPNELASIQMMGGVVIKIQRPNHEYDGHVTETEFPDEVCWSVIENSDTIKEYEDKIISDFTTILTSGFNKEN